MILSLFRGVHREHASLRAGGWQLSMARCVRGKTIGIIGLGNLGQPMAQITQAFGMRVIAWSPTLTPKRAAADGAECVSKRLEERRIGKEGGSPCRVRGEPE